MWSKFRRFLSRHFEASMMAINLATFVTTLYILHKFPNVDIIMLILVDGAIICVCILITVIFYDYKKEKEF